jgi:type I restriction enzyme R subunit
MKQAIQEGFILDVLKHYTPVESYYRLIKTVQDDPEFDTKKAQKKLLRYVESHQIAIRQKAEAMVEHFHDQVLIRQKLVGQARAMVVTSGIKPAIDTYFAIRDCLEERKSPWKALVAFSGEHKYGEQRVTEASLNGFPSSLIPERFSEDSYRFLVVAEKFQTGYDEPLLHTMYVDKVLSGIRAVQTLSRLNRAHPQKHDTFVLDFVNDADTIQKAFEPYYRTTILSAETDPNKLHDLKADLDGYQVYSAAQVEQLVRLYLGGADRDRLDPILDACVALYNEQLDEEGQVDFKGKAKAFVRTYNFLAAILPYTNAEWEKLSAFLNFLIPKLPAPKETDRSIGILEAIDLDSYRVEVQASLQIVLADQDGEIEPIPTSGGGWKTEPELDKLSNILKTFNDLFGNIDWRDPDKIRQVISEEIPSRVAADRAYQNARIHSDRQNARIEHNKALQRVITDLLVDQTELFKQFSDNDSFRKWLSETVFWLTYETAAEYDTEPVQYPVQQAAQLIQKQFGSSAKWVQINQALWEYFEASGGGRLGLSGVQRISSELGISIDDILSVMSLLTGPRQEFLRRVYYRRVDSGQTQTVPVDEVVRQTRRWWFEKEIDETEWRHWAADVLVGREPAIPRKVA